MRNAAQILITVTFVALLQGADCDPVQALKDVANVVVQHEGEPEDIDSLNYGDKREGTIDIRETKESGHREFCGPGSAHTAIDRLKNWRQTQKTEPEVHTFTPRLEKQTSVMNGKLVTVSYGSNKTKYVTEDPQVFIRAMTARHTKPGVNAVTVGGKLLLDSKWQTWLTPAVQGRRDVGLQVFWLISVSKTGKVSVTDYVFENGKPKQPRSLTVEGVIIRPLSRSVYLNLTIPGDRPGSKLGPFLMIIYETNDQKNYHTFHNVLDPNYQSGTLVRE